MDELTGEIASGLRKGSRDAWEKLYDAYAERLWREVGRLTGGNAADVADVVQEVLLTAAKSAGRFNPKRGTLWAWLTGIARRQAALYYRHRLVELERAKRWWHRLDGTARPWLVGRSDAPPAAAEANELSVLVRRSLLELPHEYRQLLTRRYLDGTRATEIAAEVGCSADAVRARLMRARQAFRRQFARIAGPDEVIETTKRCNRG